MRKSKTPETSNSDTYVLKIEYIISLARVHSYATLRAQPGSRRGRSGRGPARARRGARCPAHARRGGLSPAHARRGGRPRRMRGARGCPRDSLTIIISHFHGSTSYGATNVSSRITTVKIIAIYEF